MPANIINVYLDQQRDQNQLQILIPTNMAFVSENANIDPREH